jgi:hypothetical protein
MAEGTGGEIVAEFVQTMKDWRRMCKTIGDISCEDCKLHADGNDCVAVYEGEMDYAKLEKAVTAWAAEHPEPVYPTWFEYLYAISNPDYFDLTEFYTWMRHTPIPADIAQKLGIEPKEGT